MIVGIILLSMLVIGITYRIFRFIFPFKEGIDSIYRVYYRDKSHNEERALEIKNRMMLAFTNPESKDKQIYHGGCLSCITPETKGIGNCRKCCNFTANWSMKSRYKEKQR